MAANMNSTAMLLREDLDAIFRCVQINRNNKMVTCGQYDEDGYLEIIEGDNNTVTYIDKGNSNAPDNTVGDVNDILMGTGKVIGANRAYRGLVKGEVCESNFAEIVWFVRGTTLYRQARLIIGDDENLIAKYREPDGSINPITNFHDTNDVSVFQERINASTVRFAFNKLSDLSRRENRFAHYYVGMPDFPFPHNPKYRELRLPTMAELNGDFNVPDNVTYLPEVDLWNEPNYAANRVNSSHRSDATGTGWLSNGDRRGEDIVLTNVISFDIKVWNPNATKYDETDTTKTIPDPRFTDLGDIGDGSSDNGAFGSQGRYSGGTGENEVLVQRAYFDENSDRRIKVPDRDDPTGPWIDNPNLHHIPASYLYREDKEGNPLPLSSPPPPAGTNELPTSTLITGRWTGDPMARVFDTWTKWYERQLRMGGAVDGLLLDTLPPDATPPYFTEGSNRKISKINGSNLFTRTEFFLVTFWQEALYDDQQVGRWHYLHSPNLEPRPNPTPPPDVIDKPIADEYFSTYIANPNDPPEDWIEQPTGRHKHRGTGVLLENEVNSGKYWESPPPYDELLRGVEITIRCFDPKSGNIRQVRIVKHVDL
jgi:hypothetical protein